MENEVQTEASGRSFFQTELFKACVRYFMLNFILLTK